MVHKLKGFGFLVSGLVLGIIGVVASARQGRRWRES